MRVIGLHAYGDVCCLGDRIQRGTRDAERQHRDREEAKHEIRTGHGIS
jgi:hypothetical protein